MGDAAEPREPIEQIMVPGAAPPAGHYSPAVRHGGLVYVSGQLPVGPGGIHRPNASLEAQAGQVLDNLFDVLAAAGCTAEDLLKVTVYIVGVENWGAFNAAYAERLGAARPARAIVPVPELHHGYLLEIDAIARG
jgi:reactive intermediate/imine deaminase